MIESKELKNLEYFEDLDDEFMNKTASLFVEKNVKKNTTLLFEGMLNPHDNYRGFIVVKKGKLKVFKTSDDGREYIFYWIRPGEIFCYMKFFENNPPKLSVAAAEKSTVYFLKETDVKELIQESPSFGFNIFRSYANRTTKYIETVGDLAFKNVPERLAKVLLEVLQKEGIKKDDRYILKRDITLYDLASMVGTVREVVTRSLHKFEKDGILKIDRKKLEVIDLEQLQEIAGLPEVKI